MTCYCITHCARCGNPLILSDAPDRNTYATLTPPMCNSCGRQRLFKPQYDIINLDGLEELLDKQAEQGVLQYIHDTSALIDDETCEASGGEASSCCCGYCDQD